MIYSLGSSLRGAGAKATRLFISGVSVKALDGLTDEVLLVDGYIDTGAELTAIPIDLALRLKMITIGMVRVKSFDKGKESNLYPKYFVQLTLPGLGSKDLEVFGCQRNDILIGRDICREFQLGACWHSRWLGLRDKRTPDDGLRQHFA